MNNDEGIIDIIASDFVVSDSNDIVTFIGTSEIPVSISLDNEPSSENACSSRRPKTQSKEVLQPGWRQSIDFGRYSGSKISFSRLIYVGNEHFRRGEYPDALHSYEEAAKMTDSVERLRDNDLNCLALVAFHNMGVIHCINREFKEGFKYFLKAVIVQGHGPSTSECIRIKSTVKQLVKNYIEGNDFKAAKDLLFDAIEVFRYSSHLKETTQLFKYVMFSAIDLVHKESG